MPDGVATERLRDALQDRYQLQRELGRAGMATVYLARDLRQDRLKRRADSLTRSGSDPVTRWRARYAAKSAAAFLDLARHDTSTAIGRLLELQLSHCPSCFTDQLTLAQLLVDRQRDQEAWRILRADHPVLTLAPTATAVLWTLLRGRVAERIGERDQAIESYEWVVAMWRKPDPELQPYVAEAREALARLTSERK